MSEFCPACGNGWRAGVRALEQALVAEAWWDALNASGLSEAAFMEASR